MAQQRQVAADVLIMLIGNLELEEGVDDTCPIQHALLHPGMHSTVMGDAPLARCDSWKNLLGIVTMTRWLAQVSGMQCLHSPARRRPQAQESYWSSQSRAATCCRRSIQHGDLATLLHHH